MNYSLNIVHLYSDLLNLYGDKGNIEALKRRLLWRNIDVNIIDVTASDNTIDFENADIIFLGGGSDREMESVSSLLLSHKEALSSYIENGGVLLAICGGYQLMGKYYKTKDNEIKGIEILDITTVSDEKNRLIGDVILESEEFGKLTGFENHGGRTEIGNHTPFGKVIVGHGNDGKSGSEGVIYKNLIGTYLHGPLLPKNPKLCDSLLEKALKNKYADFAGLSPLDDTLENKASDYIKTLFLKD